MSNQHQLSSRGFPHSNGEIEHVNILSENIGALFQNHDYSDITLVVEGVRFPAHKVILAARSEYFRALLFGGMRESHYLNQGIGNAEIILQETKASSFAILLRYIYTGKVSLFNTKEEILLDVLGLAHQYGFSDLESAISDYLRSALNIRNVCVIFDLSNLYSLRSLSEAAHEFMDTYAKDVLNSDGFLSLSREALIDVISRDSFAAPEVDIFQAVCRWSDRNAFELNGSGDAYQCTSPVMKAIRLPLMTIDQLINTVRPTGLVDADRILDAIKLRTESKNMQLKYRGSLLPERNVAVSPEASVIRGEIKGALLDGDSVNYDMDRGFSRHPIDDNRCDGIVIRLDRPYIINTARLLLWDKDQRSYSYYLEVSMDDNDWVTIVDYRNYLCRSWQYLRFAPIVCQYVRIIGTHNTQNRVFHVVTLEVLYTYKPVTLQPDTGLIIVNSNENVASTRAHASVIEGVSRSRNALLNEDTRHYDWDSGYTCHQLGSGAIVVQLPQPYVVDSMRLLLWDCDDRAYSYYIEVSTNNQTWVLVCDRRNTPSKSWQVIEFPQQAVTFIRIVGTRNSANEVFHCVHFECPCNPDALKEYRDKQTQQRQLDNDSNRQLQMPTSTSNESRILAAEGLAKPLGTAASSSSSFSTTLFGASSSTDTLSTSLHSFTSQNAMNPNKQSASAIDDAEQFPPVSEPGASASANVLPLNRESEIAVDENLAGAGVSAFSNTLPCQTSISNTTSSRSNSPTTEEHTNARDDSSNESFDMNP